MPNETHALEYFQRVFIINLASRNDRLVEMDIQLKKIGLSVREPFIEVFPAIRPSDAGEFDTIGARGCFLSHLGILRRAAALGLERVLILEDDVDFADDFNLRLARTVAELSACDWHVYYGGGEVAGTSRLKSGLTHIPPDQAVGLTHFLALQTPAISAAVGYLEAQLTRHAGDALGGPMHVDGSYSWFRKDNPNLQTLLSVPQLGHQRASRTDIHELRWFDTVPCVKQVVGVVRKFRNLMRLKPKGANEKMI